MLALLLIAPLSFFSAQARQAALDMNVIEPILVGSKDDAAMSVQGYPAKAWTIRGDFSPGGVGFIVFAHKDWLLHSTRDELTLVAYHEVCHMVSDREMIWGNRLPTVPESKIIEARAERCSAAWMEELKKRKKEQKREEKARRVGKEGKSRKGFWSTLALILIMLP